MAQIFVTKPGVLNQRDRSALRKAGVVVVEAEKPDEVKLIQVDGTELSGSDLLLAAMRGVTASNVAEMAFANAFRAILEDRSTEAAQS